MSAALLRRAATITSRRSIFFSTTGSPNRNRKPPKYTPPHDVEDVSTKDFKSMINDYFANPTEDALPAITEAIFRRRLLRTHDHSDDELLEAVRRQPLDDIPDREVESDFSDGHSTQEDE